MKKLFAVVLVLLGLGGEGLAAQSCPPGPPTSRYDGSTEGTPLPGGAVQFNFEYAKLAGFDCFELVHQWYPTSVQSYSSISPNELALNMAYASHATATFTNVVVAAKGNYTLAVRYAFGNGNFPGITDRPEGIKVNGVVITYDMHFPITGSFLDYDYSNMLIPLNEGKNTIEFFDVSDHGVGRLDTMIVSPTEDKICSDAPTTPGDVRWAFNGGVELTWLGSTWPQDCTIRYYDVYRSTTADFMPSAKDRIATGLKSTSFKDATVSCGTTYYYLIQAVDTAGGSASLQKTVATPECSTAIAMGAGASFP